MITESQAAKMQEKAKEPEGMCPSDISEPIEDRGKADVSSIGGRGKVCTKETISKGWFNTWPQCPAPPVECLNDLVDKFQEKGNKIVEYLICQEDHKDGNKHLHGFLKLEKRIRFSPRLFDFIYEGKQYHGHYESAKSWKAVKEYCKKFGNYISNFDVKAASNKQAKKIGKEELERDALDLLDEGIISGMQLNNFLKNQNTYKLLKQKRLASTIKLDVPKKRHEWFYGDSDSGKTYQLKKRILEAPGDWFQIPTNNDWVGYNNEKYLYLDEYKGQLTIQELNRICDGGSKVNVKGGTTILNPECVVVICSNWNIKETYGKVEDRIKQTLYNRFNEKRCVVENGVYSIIV